MPPTDPTLTVRNLLDTNWDPSNTNGTKPNIHTGKYREDTADPQVAITPDGETPIDGGDTGYAAIAPDGSGGIQRRAGVLACDIRDNYDRTDNPKGRLWEFVAEIRRIVLANQTNNDDLETIAPGAQQGPDQTNQEPVRLQVIQPVQYLREDRP